MQTSYQLSRRSRARLAGVHTQLCAVVERGDTHHSSSIHATTSVVGNTRDADVEECFLQQFGADIQRAPVFKGPLINSMIGETEINADDN